jgi:hypothetical protein
MPLNRRVFFGQSLLLTCATMLGGRVLAEVPQAGSGVSSDPIARMKWMNEPAHGTGPATSWLFEVAPRLTSGGRPFTATLLTIGTSRTYP